MKINGHEVAAEKVGTTVRDRRRSTSRGTQRYVTVYTWNALVDGAVVMDGCATKREAMDYAHVSAMAK